MGPKSYKIAITVLMTAMFSLQSFAQTSATPDPIKLLLETTDLNLKDKNAVKIRDREFKSNDPLVIARVFTLKDGIKVKLVGRAFDEPSDILKIRVIYKEDQRPFEETKTLLTEHYGVPSNKDKRVNVWRTDNPVHDSRQSSKIKIIAIDKDNDRWIISADRQKGGIGNISATKTTNKPVSKTTQHRRAINIQSDERD